MAILSVIDIYLKTVVIIKPAEDCITIIYLLRLLVMTSYEACMHVSFVTSHTHPMGSYPFWRSAQIIIKYLYTYDKRVISIGMYINLQWLVCLFLVRSLLVCRLI